MSGSSSNFFDFNHDGKLDALEMSAKMEFWDEISKDHSSEYGSSYVRGRLIVRVLLEYFPEYAALRSQEPAEGLTIGYRKPEYEVYIETPRHLYQYSKMYDDLFMLDGESCFLEDEQSRWTK